MGLAQTAAAATGAGLVMVAALIPFATTSLLNVRAFGIGVAIAILLDILIVRPVLLPAAIAVLGRRGWWPTQTSATPQPPRHRAGTDVAPLPTAAEHSDRSITMNPPTLAITTPATGAQTHSTGAAAHHAR